MKKQTGSSLVELLIVIGLAALLLPALFLGFITSREGRAQQALRLPAVALMKETEVAVKNVKATSNWESFAALSPGTYHPTVSGSSWTLASGSATINGFTQQVVLSDVLRASSGEIVTSGGTNDPSTKKAEITIAWTQPYPSSTTSTFYLNRITDASNVQTVTTDFSGGILTDTQVTNTNGGEVKLANNNKAKWCSPAFASATIDLPDGPPVAVAATASAVSASIPNDVFVATSPSSSSAIKMAYINVSANVATPTATLKGTFTMQSSQYSGTTFPTGTGLSNDFKTTDVRYYKAASGKLYALLATDLPDKEVVVVQINNGTSDAYQDPVNKIYTYWTYFNTKRYYGNTSSTPNQDQAPFGYGATSLAVLGDRGYVSSGGYLYVFDLSNIDSKSTSSSLDMVGCRIQLDGYDCNPGSPGSDAKYSSGQTGTSYGDTASPAHNDCSDGGNIELNATNDLSPVQVGSSTYVFAAIGAGTNPELDIVNATSVPTSGTSPSISNNSCGRISGGNSGWKRISSYDFNTDSGTEEAANSVYAKSDGTRAYISSNGGIDGDGDGQGDSKQFYIINTSNKSSPVFLSGSPSSGPSSGFYNGSGANAEMYPRRSLTVLNGERVVLVGKDGVSNSADAEEYQVLDSSTEATPAYCSGLNFDQGFNDLTSVSEADLDNFVYMVANTTNNELKIIEGGPDSAIYVNSGIFESKVFDATSSVAFNRFTATASQPAQTTVQMQVSSIAPVSGSCPTNASAYTFVGPGGDPAAYFTPQVASLSGTIPFGNYLSDAYQNPQRCLRYKAWFSTTDTTKTPILYDITTKYSP